MHSIFAHDSHVHTCWVNVVEEEGRRYFAHMSVNRALVEKCGQVVEGRGAKCLYRIRVKHDQTFPTAGRRRKK